MTCHSFSLARMRVRPSCLKGPGSKLLDRRAGLNEFLYQPVEALRATEQAGDGFVVHRLVSLRRKLIPWGGPVGEEVIQELVPAVEDAEMGRRILGRAGEIAPQGADIDHP
jgi:hypothetical protein